MDIKWDLFHINLDYSYTHVKTVPCAKNNHGVSLLGNLHHKKSIFKPLAVPEIDKSQVTMPFQEQKSLTSYL